MTSAAWFWTILVFALVFGFIPDPTGPSARWFCAGRSLVWVALLGLLGWAIFGAPIK